MTEWFLIQDGKEHGPLSTQEMRQLARTGKLQPHSLVKRGANVEPVRADKISVLFAKLKTGQQATTPPPLPQELSVPEFPETVPPPFPGNLDSFPPSRLRILFEEIAKFVVIVVGVAILKIAVFFIVGLATGFDPPSISQINVSWSDGTGQLTTLLKIFKPEKKALLGLEDLKNGMVMSALSIQIHNTGNVPVYISPKYLQIHFGDEVTKVNYLKDARFLQPTSLKPGESATGLVTYSTRLDSGAGEMSYQQDYVRVTYD